MRRCLTLLPLILAGCDEPTPSRPDPTPPPPATGFSFDPARTGRVAGVVRWAGPRPDVPPLESTENPLDFAGGPRNPKRRWPNPNAPRVTADGRLAGAFVWLEGVDPARSRPWDPAPLTVELKGRKFSSPRGLARVGDEIAFVSRDPFHHSLQARGACHFGLTLPEHGAVRKRRLESAGVVELRSGSGLLWMRSYVLVQPHPYMAVSDELGRFAFDAVPDGAYRLVAWHPGWRVAGRERNPDTLYIVQVAFGEEPRSARPIRVGAGLTAEAEVALGGGS
ncbi:MAG: carboxypeptidase regulatory-like domain-containing protein [Gemmataceae bacterium]